jgi:chaperonin GroEL
MSKHILHGDDARKAIVRGVDFLADAVKITEGPRGRNIILGQRAIGQSPKVTRDGVTVSNYADPCDRTEQMGADLVREAAQKTDNAVGDGTTATVVLAQSMIHTGFQMVRAGQNPMAMERGIRKAVDVVIDRLGKMAVKVSGNKIFQVATVSAHGDTEIGELVADAVNKAGVDGVVTAEPSSTSRTYVESVAGLEIPKASLIHGAFITHPEEVKAELLDCKILLWEGVIATAKSLVPILTQVRGNGGTEPAIPLIIIAGGYEQEALSMLISNKIRAALPLNAVRMDAYGERRKELMRDIAALCGGRAYTEDDGVKIESVKLSEVGSARKVITTMSKTQILQGRGKMEDLKGRVSTIKTAMENAAPAELQVLRSRLAALTGGITIIKVGGTTVTEMEEKKDRVVDAMSAAKAAVEGGIVPGGGTALLHAAEVLFAAMRKRSTEDEWCGWQVVHEACRSVVKQIAENAGIDVDLLMNQLNASSTLGYNAFNGEFEDMVETGIIDPVNVVIESLRNAAAVACSILTMGATVAEFPTEKTNG